MKKGKENKPLKPIIKKGKMFKAVTKGKCNRVLRLCEKRGYGPEVVEELILMAHFNGWTPRQQVVSFTYNR